MILDKLRDIWQANSKRRRSCKTTRIVEFVVYLLYDSIKDVGKQKGGKMTNKDRVLIRYAKKVNTEIPRNGSSKMDNLAFSKLAKKVCKIEKKAMQRLAAN